MRRIAGFLFVLAIIGQPIQSADRLSYSTVQFEKIEPETKEDKEMFARTHEVKNVVNELTEEEAEVLMTVAQAEAGNQGEEGMRLVMSVIINRQESEAFPDSIKEVAFQDNQFTTVQNGAIISVEPSNECITALEMIEAGFVAPEIIAFETVKSNSLDRYFVEAFRFKDHIFYKKK